MAEWYRAARAADTGGKHRYPCASVNEGSFDTLICLAGQSMCRPKRNGTGRQCEKAAEGSEMAPSARWAPHERTPSRGVEESAGEPLERISKAILGFCQPTTL